MIMKNYQVLIITREKFTQQISFRSKDKDILLVKTLVYIAAKDEAFMVHNREMNAHSIQNERNDINVLSDRRDWDRIEAMPMAGKKIDDWLLELDNIANEELFKVNLGHLFGIVTGRCVEDPESVAFDLTCNSLPGLDIATNQDMIGIYLANLIAS
ncbi:hypothetical protein Hanom_Chr12g01157051 [Helianthus anomalus]